jgi:signal transduction histidine kinase
MERSPLLSGLPEGEFRRLLATGARVPLAAGDLLLEEGQPGDLFYLILSGEVEIIRNEGGRTTVLDAQGAGGFLGEMSLLENRPRSASARATQDTEVLALPPDAFRDLLARCPEVAVSMLQIVLARLRSTEASDIQDGRMAGLGTLAAGLAHELNNPAAAIARNTALLKEAMEDWRRCEADLARLPISGSESGVVDRLRLELDERTGSVPDRSGDSGRVERELETWLQDHGVEEAWEIAPVLAEAGWDRTRLDPLAGHLSPDHLPPILRWFASGLEVSGLAQGIQTASSAISDIVSRVRSYSFLDRGAVQMVDVARTIEDAVSILKGRFAPSVAVHMDLPSDLPPIEAYGGELGQVWTNLIHNALDAMNGTGILGIEARPTDGGVVVRISDTGPGIPDSIRPRIFDPFFTTKPEGHGTGLGLAISWGIVVNQHRGRIRVHSRTGHTVMEVILPGKLPSGRGAS